MKSRQHLSPVQGYKRATYPLAGHFGNEYKIASAYMDIILNWPLIKPEDVEALLSFSLFLQGCCNLTQQIIYMKEFDLPSNLRNIVMKLPYKLRGKWKNVTCDLQEERVTWLPCLL